jgi:hypothetical protein
VPDNPTKDALYELLDYLELVETQSGSLMAFLRDNGIVTDEKLAPYLEQAASATEVKSRAIHARFDFLFDSDRTSKSSTEVNPTPPKEQPAAVAPQQRTSDKTDKTDVSNEAKEKVEDKEDQKEKKEAA